MDVDVEEVEEDGKQLASQTNAIGLETSTDWPAVGWVMKDVVQAME